MIASAPLRVLIVEDSDDDLLLLLRELRQAGFAPRWTQVQTADEFRTALESDRWDVVLSNYQLPQLTAPVVLDIL
ncbi:MAG: hypothetical protein WBG38_20540, partial [Nodosilinea sp.]